MNAAIASLDRGQPGHGDHEAEELAEELGALRREHAGIVRTGAGLRAGHGRLHELRRRAAHARSQRPDTAAFARAQSLRFMLCAAELILQSARLHDESRGAHFREDAPRPGDGWQCNVFCHRGADGRPRLWREPVPPMSPGLQAAVAEAPDVEYHVE